MSIAVDKIVRQLLILQGREPNGPYYPMYLEMALMGLREMQNDFEVVEEKIYEVTGIDQTTRSAGLPSDYVTWKSVGYLIGEHYVRMYHDSQLKNWWAKDDCGNPIQGNEYESYWYLNWWYSNGYTMAPDYGFEYNGRLYGLGGGSQLGGFSIEGGQILFNSQCDLTGNYPILMVYAPTGISPDGNSVINDYAAEALRAWMRYQLALNSNNRSMGEIDMTRSIWEKERMRAKVRIYSLPIAEIADRIRQGTQSTATF